MDLKELKSKTLNELEELYREDRPVDVPAGIYRGTILRWFPKTEAEPRWSRPLSWLGFDLAPFGVDFDKRRWFFWFDRAPRFGHFNPVVGQSFWYKDALTLQLHYETSRLPDAIKSTLYDEVKPISEDLCLGIGGLNPRANPFRIFFFALEKQ